MMYAHPTFAGILGAEATELITISSVLAARGGFWLHGSGFAGASLPTIDSWTPQAQTVAPGTFVQATAAAKPSVEVVAGQNTAAFDTDEFLKSNASTAAWSWLHAAAGCTLYVVWRRTGGAGTHTLLDTSNGNVNNHGMALMINATNVLSARVSNGSGVAHFTASVDYDNWSGSVANMSIAELAWSSATGYELRVDGGTGARLATGVVTGVASSSNATGALALGAVTAGSTQWLTGIIAEVLILIGVATNPQRRGVLRELASRHAITLQP